MRRCCRALACGALPAFRASSSDFTRLRDGSRGSTRQRHWARDGLVVGQTALALVLLIGSGLLVRSFWALRSVDPGYDTKDLFTFQIAPEGPHLPDGPAYARFSLQFMDRLRALPGVESVGLVENIPLNEGTAARGSAPRARRSRPTAARCLQVTFAAGDYFKAMGIDVVAGGRSTRTITCRRCGTSSISQSAAALLWPGQNAIGKRLQRPGLTGWDTVIGVVDDVQAEQLPRAAESAGVLPARRAGASQLGDLVAGLRDQDARARRPSRPTCARIVREVAPEAPMYRVYTMAGLAATRWWMCRSRCSRSASRRRWR